MNNLFYELKPVALLALGVYAIRGDHNNMMFASGWILVVACTLILHTRLRHRGIL